MAGSSWHCRARRVAVAAAAIAAGLAASAAAGVSVGGEGGAWLRAAAGAEALAMGGAATATPACLYAWWNPAMLVNTLVLQEAIRWSRWPWCITSSRQFTHFLMEMVGQ